MIFLLTPDAGLSTEFVAACLGTIVGAFTLTRSVISLAKLNANLSSKEWNLPRNITSICSWCSPASLSQSYSS